jgi:hypothetical protein
MPMGPVFMRTESFDREFARLVNATIPEIAADALFQGGLRLLRYAIEEEPKAPHKSGRLWNSQQVDPPVIKPDHISVVAGFNCEYAAAVHEAPSNWHWTLEGSGPKFLETKSVRHREDLIKYVADKIKEKAK